MGQPSLISEYDLGAEGDLFKAPEPILEEPLLALDPVAAAISIMSGSDNAMNNTVKASDMSLSEALYKCEKELMEESAIEETISELLDVKIPMLQVEDVLGELRASADGCLLQKSRLGANTPGAGIAANVQASGERLVTISDLKREQRRQKLNRYREKKIQRNFGRKIKEGSGRQPAEGAREVRQDGRWLHAQAKEVDSHRGCCEADEEVRQGCCRKLMSALSGSEPFSCKVAFAVILESSASTKRRLSDGQDLVFNMNKTST
uniref:CCT domain-containing protein n=1 Tax=Aegilops tauschii TaxID=37682 RepID=M8ASE0_AEGTA